MDIYFDIKNNILREYLGFLFKKENNAYLITRDIPFGKMLCAYFETSSLPIKHNITPNAVLCRLPKCHSTGKASQSFIYYSKEDTAKLNDFLDAYFKLDFDTYYLQGRKINIPQKEIINSYIQSRFSVGMEDNYEMLKKRAYREEVNNIGKKQQYFKNRAYYFAEKVEKSLLEIANGLISVQ